MDEFMMESHKMLWHLDRVSAWKKGDRIAPLHIDAGLSRGCNIRCKYCFGKTQGNSYRGGMKEFLSKDVLLNYVRDAGAVGVRSIAMIGEAEPTLNPHLYEAIVLGKKSGVDISLGTNGILFDTEAAGQEALESLTWIRFNLSAASNAGYKRIHGLDFFDAVKEKIAFVTAYKKKFNLSLTVGIQMVLIPTPENLAEVLPLAQLGKNLGVDYFVVKQCSDTTANDCGSFDKLKEYTTDGAHRIFRNAEELSSDSYKVIVKWTQLQNLGKRTYDTCLGTPFLLFSSGDGKVYPCGQFFIHREEEFRLGDLNQMSFRQIVESDRYWEVMNRVQSCVNVHKDCYANCRTNSINEFLWKISTPPKHVNFI